MERYEKIEKAFWYVSVLFEVDWQQIVRPIRRGRKHADTRIRQARIMITTALQSCMGYDMVMDMFNVKNGCARLYLYEGNKRYGYHKMFRVHVDNIKRLIA